MALFCKENHCGSCEKAFCCFSCRSKHEIYVHKRTKPDSSRKVLAQIRNVMFQSHNSLPKIPESETIDFQDLESNTRKKNQRTLSICTYKDNSNLSQLEAQPKSDDKSETPSVLDTINIYTETDEEYNSTNSMLTDNKKQASEVHRLKFSENVFNVIVNVDESMKCFGAPRYRNNTESLDISETCNFSSTTAGNTPPRTQQHETIDSIHKGQSTKNENSSVYCPCFENLTTSRINSKWINTKSYRADSLPGEDITEYKNQDHMERSSIYFACSEYFTDESTADKLTGIGISVVEGLHTFEIDPEIASTKLEMTTSFTPELYSEGESELKTMTIDSTDAEYLTPNLTEFPDDTNIESNTDDISNGEGSDSASQNPFSILMDSVYSINTTYATIDQDSTLSTAEQSSAEIGDNSLWQSFSNSIQRAYNSTKEMCTIIGRKNRSKRELDDLEELQPAPKRPKTSVLCRPPIRDNPRIIFRQDGDTRRAVILYDKGTQTDLLY